MDESFWEGLKLLRTWDKTKASHGGRKFVPSNTSQTKPPSIPKPYVCRRYKEGLRLETMQREYENVLSSLINEKSFSFIKSS